MHSETISKTPKLRGPKLEGGARRDFIPRFEWFQFRWFFSQKPSGDPVFRSRSGRPGSGRFFFLCSPLLCQNAKKKIPQMLKSVLFCDIFFRSRRCLSATSQRTAGATRARRGNGVDLSGSGIARNYQTNLPGIWLRMTRRVPA